MIRHTRKAGLIVNYTTQYLQLAVALDSQEKALVFCFCRNDAASVAWYLGALEAGHAVALLDEAMADEFKARLIGLYAPEFIVSSGGGTDYAAEHFGSIYEALSPALPGSCLWGRQSPPNQPLHPDVAVLLSTSGTTGSPKFVRLTKSNLVSNAQSIANALTINGEDRAISSLPFHYSYGLSVLNTHLLCGATIVLTDEGLVSSAFWNVFRDMRCTSFAGVPYSYQILRRLKLDSLNVPSLHTMTQAGGKLHTDLVSEFHTRMAERSGRFFVMYGQTEATARIAILPSQCLPAKLGSVGLPVPGGSFAIEAAGGLTTEPNILGELVYTGPNVMMGYATSRADLAQGDTLRGSLHTADSAYLDADGFLYITGRMKRDAKLFGLRLNLDEIEAMLRAHGPTAVVASGEKLHIFCEYGDAGAFARYQQELSEKLHLHIRAFEFRRVEQLPLHTNGKVDYGVLLEDA